MREGDEIGGRYRLEELQGRGPLSEVWRAHDRTLDRTVALKILSPAADLGRFRREARAAAALSHEHVMRVFDYGEDEAGPFMVLEWLPGGTLEERLGSGPLPDAETRRVATGIAAGLAHLHERGLMHRDLKPANVLFDDEDRPKLADFGLARSAAGAGTLTAAGTVLGTAAYISPEQAAGEPASRASDVYSFGVLLFRMLTGALPFVSDDALALLDLHRRSDPPAVADVRPDAPPALATLADSALAKDPADRPADGAALLGALGAAPSVAALPDDTERTRVLEPAGPAPPRRSRRSVAAIGVALVALAAAGGLLAWAVTRPATTAPAGVVSTAGGHHRTHTHHAAAATTGSTAPSVPTAPATSVTHTRTRARRRTTSAATTTTAPATTAPTTTAPTTTAPTTTAPTTTAATTTGVLSTTTATWPSWQWQ